ncbi:PIN domain [Ceraceosorus bombacis]|uniref:PIN domain n=1 Tax=Ceraceosorus bombacis TaxID=401625 RepID=A0A0P1B8J8_9BASI|nr:PIN domain [Ceraceosorus bombacis]
MPPVPLTSVRLPQPSQAQSQAEEKHASGIAQGAVKQGPARGGGEEERDAAVEPQEKSVKQKSLCQQMGALFLQHRVRQLEGQVDDLQYSRSASSSAPATTPSLGKEADTRGGEGRSSSASIKEPVRSSRGDRFSTQPQNAHFDHSRRASVKTYILDASVLIYSLRSVHDWLKAPDVRCIVPTEVVSTLDILKKGQHPLNAAARKATRFLEDRFASPAPDGSMPSAGLVPQATAPSSITLDEAELLREACAEADQHPSPLQRTGNHVKSDMLVPNVTSSGATRRSFDSSKSKGSSAGTPTVRSPTFDSSGGPATRRRSRGQNRSPRFDPMQLTAGSTLSLFDAPVWIRATLLCALSFLPGDAQLTVALPPPSLATVTTSPQHSAAANSELPKHVERADGGITQAYAQAHGLDAHICSTSASWLQLEPAGMQSPVDVEVAVKGESQVSAPDSDQTLHPADDFPAPALGLDLGKAPILSKGGYAQAAQNPHTGVRRR